MKKESGFPKEVYGQYELSGDEEPPSLLLFECREHLEDGVVAIYELKRVVKKKTRTTVSFK